MHRLFFVHHDYIADSVLTLIHDSWLDPRPQKTTVYFGCNDLPYDLVDKYQQYGIDTQGFEVVRDKDIVNPYTTDNIYQFGGWISQQLLKLIAVDLCDADRILIQDCDTFALCPVRLFDQHSPIMVCREPRHIGLHPQYIQYFEEFTGEQTLVKHNFVTEFMPILKSDWVALKNRIQDRFQCHWLTAMCRVFAKTSTQQQIWFSEYQLLGLWAFCQHQKLNTSTQRRFWLTSKMPWQTQLARAGNSNFACNSRCFTLENLGIGTRAV